MSETKCRCVNLAFGPFISAISQSRGQSLWSPDPKVSAFEFFAGEKTSLCVLRNMTIKIVYSETPQQWKFLEIKRLIIFQEHNQQEVYAKAGEANARADPAQSGILVWWRPRIKPSSWQHCFHPQNCQGSNWGGQSTSSGRVCSCSHSEVGEAEEGAGYKRSALKEALRRVWLHGVSELVEEPRWYSQGEAHLAWRRWRRPVHPWWSRLPSLDR